MTGKESQTMTKMYKENEYYQRPNEAYIAYMPASIAGKVITGVIYDLS